DTYTISIYTAKIVYGFNLQNSKNIEADAAKFKAEYEAKANAAKADVTSKGYTLNENYEYVKDGKVETKNRKMTKEEIDLTVRSVSRVVKIGMFMDRYPAELSGGQQQRVAIARTLAPKPTVLFMDEPLSNLDAKLRLEMRSELQRLHLTTGSTFVYVTHDQLEAMTLATKICLIENGNLQQYDAPLTVYNKPKNLFVADFVGNPAINFVNTTGCQAEDGSMKLSMWDGINSTFTFANPTNVAEWKASKKAELDAKAAALAEAKKHPGHVDKANKDSVFKYPIARVEDPIDDEGEAVDYVLGIRPETISITPDGKLEGEIYSAMPRGMETTVRIKVGNYLITGVVFGGITYDIGEKVKVNFTGDIMLFDKETGDLIDTGKLAID
ncbi:MAG: ABC transporter ATP-binding protein, partial [Clostridia bacterium]|nr:ABC transporter ATP-binding protein [Clostridia bacterium]